MKLPLFRHFSNRVNELFCFRVYPSEDWIQSQIPEIVKSNVEALRDDTSDVDEMDAETFVQAYVNIVAGACISLGMLFLQIYLLNVTLSFVPSCN